MTFADFVVLGVAQPKTAGRFSAQKCYDWCLQVKAAATAWQAVRRDTIEFAQPLRVELSFSFRTFDLDILGNELAACVLDCLSLGGLLPRHANVVDLVITKRQSTSTEPHLRVVIEALSEVAA